MGIVNFLVVTAVLSTHVGACKTLSATKAYVCPPVRYCAWDSLTEEEHTLFGTIGYDESSWDSFDGNGLEDKVWAELSSDEQDVMTAIQYVEETYNVCINHFKGFTWKELEELEDDTSAVSSISQMAKLVYEEMGYNETAWDGAETVEKLDWDNFAVGTGSDNRLMIIGYNKQSWDGDSLPWGETATYPFELDCNSPILAGTPYECDLTLVATGAKSIFVGVSLADLDDEFVIEDFDNAVSTAFVASSGADEVTVLGKYDPDPKRGYGEKSLGVDLELLTFFTCDGECDEETLGDAVAKAKQTKINLEVAQLSGDLVKGIQEASKFNYLDDLTIKELMVSPEPEVYEPPVSDTDDECDPTFIEAILDCFLGVFDFFWFLN